MKTYCTTFGNILIVIGIYCLYLLLFTSFFSSKVENNQYDKIDHNLNQEIKQLNITWDKIQNEHDSIRKKVLKSQLDSTIMRINTLQTIKNYDVRRTTPN
jgi:predicted PurR-regulated permease PerM